MSFKKPLLVIVIVFSALICVQQIERNTIKCDCESPIMSITKEHKVDEIKHEQYIEDMIEDGDIDKDNEEAAMKINVDDLIQIKDVEKDKTKQKLQNYFHEYWNSILEG